MSQISSFSSKLNTALLNFFAEVKKKGEDGTAWATGDSKDYHDFVRSEGQKIAQASGISPDRDLKGLFNFLDSLFMGGISFGKDNAEDILRSKDYQGDSALNHFDGAKLEDINLLHELGHEFSAHDTAMVLKNISNQVNDKNFDPKPWLDLLLATTNRKKINEIFIADAGSGSHTSHIFETDAFPLGEDHRKLNKEILATLLHKGADLNTIDTKVSSGEERKAYLTRLWLEHLGSLARGIGLEEN